MGEPATDAPLAPSPRLGTAVRSAISDFYFNSLRLVGANLLWGAMVLAIMVLGASVSGLALLLVPLLALPTAGIYRVAALIARGRPVSLADAGRAWRSHGIPALALGTALVAGPAVLATNLASGLATADTPGVVLATASAWGLLAMGVLALTAWPLLVDPARDGTAVRDRLRMALFLVMAHPGRMLGLAIVVAVVLLASAVAFVALLSIGVAFAALVACRYVLPAADRLEARLAARTAAG